MLTEEHLKQLEQSLLDCLDCIRMTLVRIHEEKVAPKQVTGEFKFTAHGIANDPKIKIYPGAHVPNDKLSGLVSVMTDEERARIKKMLESVEKPPGT